MRTALTFPNNPAGAPAVPGPLVGPNIRARTRQLPRIVRPNTSGTVPAPILAHTGPFIPGNFRKRPKVLPIIRRPNTSGTVPYPQIAVAGPLVKPNTRPRLKQLPIVRRPESGKQPLPILAGPGPLVAPNVRKRLFTALRFTPRQAQPPVPPPVVPGAGPLVVPNTRPRLKWLPIVRRPESGQVPEPILAGPGPLIPPNVRKRVFLGVRMTPRVTQPPAPILAGPGPLVPPNTRPQIHWPRLLRRPNLSVAHLTGHGLPKPNVRPQVHPLPRVARRRGADGFFPAAVTPAAPAFIAPNTRPRITLNQRFLRRPNTSGTVAFPNVNQLLAMPAGTYPAGTYPAGGTTAGQPSIAPVGVQYQVEGVNGVGSTSTMAVTLSHVGDLFVATAEVNQNTTPAAHVTGVVDTNGNTWVKAIAGAGGAYPASGFTHSDIEIWYTTVTTTGATTLTFTWSASVAANFPAHSGHEFSSGLGARSRWSVDASAISINVSSTSVTFPTLTPTRRTGGELYYAWGELDQVGGATNQTPAGFTYTITSVDDNIIPINTDIVAAAAAQGTSTPAGVSTTIAALFSVS